MKRSPRFFIQRARAVGEHGGGEIGHFAFARRIKGRAGTFEADLHIDNRVVVARHQQHLRALGGVPTLDIDGVGAERQGGAGQQQKAAGKRRMHGGNAFKIDF